MTSDQDRLKSSTAHYKIVRSWPAPDRIGKSLTYQLAALLQPGIAAVVDPLKSLMVDQCNSLLKNQIDCIAYINSSLSAAERNEAMEKIRRGQVLLAFISPERLQVKDFRDELFSATEEYGKSFSYCVVDEAHCVSEWGHDFRTSYLQLGQNGRRFCKSKGRDEVTFIALTATASYDVLADIQRELDIEDEGAIIRWPTYPETNSLLKCARLRCPAYMDPTMKCGKPSALQKAEYWRPSSWSTTPPSIRP